MTNHPAIDGFAAWSPDGSRIAFSSGRAGNPNLFQMARDGSDIRQLTSSPGVEEFTGVVARRHAHCLRIGGWRQPRSDGSERRTGRTYSTLAAAPGRDSSPTWSPDGARLAFVSERSGNPDVYVANVDGSDLVNITADASNDTSPAWSLSGNYIAFVSDRGGTRDIFTVNADGTGIVAVTEDGHGDEEGQVWRPSG